MIKYAPTGLVALALAGCGADHAQKQASALLPSCVKVPARAELPRGFPARFPLPRGTVITSAQASATGGIVVRGLVPRTLSGTKEFFEEEIPNAGFQAGKGDAERGEAEAEFSGKGVEGKWKVNAFADCPGAVALFVAVARTT